MTTQYDRTEEYHGTWADRSHWNRQWENLWQQKAIGNIEDFLSTVKWDELGKDPTFSQQEKTNVYNELQQLHKDSGTYKTDISNLTGDLGTARSDIDLLNTRLDNWDTTTEVGDVVGLEDVISGLKDKYAGVGEVSDLKDTLTGTQQALSNLTGTGEGSISDQIKTATDALGINDYLKTSDFNTRMTDNLNTLSQTLAGQWGADIAALDLEGVRQSIADQGGDLSALTENFAGLTSDMDWIKKLDLGGLDDRINTQGTNLTNLINQQGENLQTQLSNQQTQWKGDLTDLQNILESGRGEALANLEGQLGKDRAADLLNLKQQLEEGRLSDIQGMAGNLRQEFGDQVFDLSDTFDQRLGDVQTALGGDISKLFEQSGTLSGKLESGLETLTSGLGTTTQQLEALRDSFGDYKTDAATNLANVQQAFGKQVGDLGTDFTNRLSDLQSSTAQDLLGLRGDVESDRAKAISDLDTTWSGKLKAQDQRLQDQFQQGSDALNKRLSDISSSMNYRMLGDSAQGVKIRRSRAYNQGRTRAGTGQLGRSMKISTLNI